MRVSWISGCKLVAMAATVVVLQGAGNAIAQFSPLPQSPGQNQPYLQNQGLQNPRGAQGRYQANAPNQVHTPQQVYPQNPAYTQNLNQIYSQNPTYPQTPIQTQMQPQYTAMAFQPNGSQPNGGQTLVPTAEAVAPAPMQVGGYAAQAGPGCNTCQPAAVPSYQSYGNDGCAPGGNGYNTFSDSCGSGGYGGIGSGLGLGARRGCGRRWFGGFYGLYMERAGNARVPLGYATTVPAWGNYPSDMEIGLTTQDLDAGYQSGAEVRFGSTFGNALGCGPVWGWEVAYWGLAEETTTARLEDMATFASDGTRTYSMIDFRGLEVDMGSGFYRPVNSYFDYGMPQADHTNDPNFVGTDLEIRSLVARSTFSTQSIELNLLRLPMFGGGAVGGGSCGGGGCDTGGCASGSYGGGRGVVGRRGRGGIAPFCGPRHSLTTLMGLRFLRFDEDFSLRSNVDLVSGGATVGSAFIDYNVEADNQLVGFQLGCNGIYRLGCQGRWALQYGSSFGIYGNRMEVSQRFDLPTGGVATRYVNGTQSNFDVNSTKNDVAFLGELRLGGSYQYSQNWRLYGGWRALAVSGVALTTGQISTGNFITPAQAGYINSSGSIFLHGLQSGVEFTY